MKLVAFALGIRTVRSFSIEDKLGAIVDEILYSPESLFNEKFFPEVHENHNTKILLNPSTANRFSITPQDYVFEYNVNSDFDLEFEKYLKNYVFVLTQKIFKEHRVRNILRFGIVIKSELEEKNAFLREISHVIKNHRGVEDSLSLRFNVITKKPLKIDKLITEDYDNEIVTYDRSNMNSPLTLSVDFQKYFKPELNIIEDSTPSFEVFCRNALKTFKTSYLPKQ